MEAIPVHELRRLLADFSHVKVSASDIDGQTRGKVMSKDKFLKAVEEGFGFCSVLFTWDMLDKAYDPKCGSVNLGESGFSDIMAFIDTSTFRKIPWENNMPHFLLDLADPKTRDAFPLCPRSLLKRAIRECTDLGFRAMCGMEFEFYNMRETPESLAQKGGSGLVPLTPGMFGYSFTRPALNRAYFNDILEQCFKYGIPIEGFHTETGPGVFEAALHYTDALQAADRAHLFKNAAKQIALEHGVMACFMAKPWNDLPGCSGHLHFSLLDNDTSKNAFASEDESKTGVDSPDALSSNMKSFIAGLLYALPSIMPFLAPTVNSYKRLVENYWAPITVSYGFENRTTAIRIISPPTCPPSATRLEMRVPGADANPYLAIAACLAAGAYGIRKKLELNIPPVRGDVGTGGSSKGERLARTLKEATDKMMAAGSPAREILGDAFIDHFGMTRLHEWKLWEASVTDWEVKRYMETV
ncbi:hypothetical protein BC832DRAFT_9856 [Gaertneriomyces semiglobifer]|nr:hypothetical protein BC832DRAFT_9856 [Gaertneriomyces semiglobifer]